MLLFYSPQFARFNDTLIMLIGCRGTEIWTFKVSSPRGSGETLHAAGGRCVGTRGLKIGEVQ